MNSDQRLFLIISFRYNRRIMKPLLLTFLVIVLTFFPAIHANPINIASTLILETNSTKIASTLEYYGYTRQPSENGYNVYKCPDSTVIKYTFQSTNSVQIFPIVQVYSRTSRKELDRILKGLNFQKVGHCYENISSPYSMCVTKCKYESNKSVVFQRILK